MHQGRDIVNATKILSASLFALSIVAAGVAGVELSGFFPADCRPTVLAGAGGRALIGLLSFSALGLGIAALWSALGTLPWTVIVICGGLGILLAPMVFELLPRAFWDSRLGVLTMTGIASALLAVTLGVAAY